MRSIWGVLALFCAGAATARQLLPPPLKGPAIADASAAWFDCDFNLHPFRTVYIDRDFADRRDTGGLTLIPPTAHEFAEVFVEDLTALTKKKWSLKVVDKRPIHGKGIYLTASKEKLTYLNGDETDEGYTLDIKRNGGVVIAGTGARGMFWGTRTLLQLLLYSGGRRLPAGHFTDAPAYPTRGYMLDAGRKWYTPSFLKDLCTYASFFKMSEFHYHATDNYPLNRGHNETWQDVYSQFALHPIDEEIFGLVQRANETLSPEDLEDLQQHCAKRGVTVVAEIEAPGHCLSITKWKPELALETKKDLLNLSHPDSIPTVKKMWADFLPRLHSKVIHIGADEYDPELADDYINFVNEMSAWVKETSNKTIRIWGTYEPSPTGLTLSPDVVIQHWQIGQSEPLELFASGHNVINSDDRWAYMSIKNDHTPVNPRPYPVIYNQTRVLDFGDIPGNQWDPSYFYYDNASVRIDPTSKQNKGAILAAWNDNGPDASTQLEAYYAMRRGIPLVGARAWSGARGPLVQPDTLDKDVDFLTARIPSANLDRVVARQHGIGKRDSIVSWKRSRHHGKDVKLGLGSKGLNYTLTLTATGPFKLSSSDVSLTLTPSDKGSQLVFTADGYPYPLRSTTYDHSTYFDSPNQGRIWDNPPGNMTESTHEPITIRTPSKKNPVTITITTDLIRGSRCWIDGQFVGRFEVLVFHGRNTYLSWSQMAFVAPLEKLSGGVERIDVKDRIVEPGHH